MKNDYFKWDSNFVTGHELIDKQHYGFIEIINNLMKLSFQIEEVNYEELENFRDTLIKYTKEHFKTEEGMMNKYSLDNRYINKHKKLHKEFIDKIFSYFEYVDQLKSKEKLTEISEFLIRWLAYHILSVDKVLVRQVQNIENENLTPKEAYEIEIDNQENNTEPLIGALKSLFLLVSQKNQELESINKHLEQKVQERTKELQNLNNKLEEISLKDELTGIPNRRYALMELEKFYYNKKRYGNDFSVIFVDLDKFKSVNDNYGHEFGDKVLKWVSKLMVNNTRESDIVCRIGGDEFIIIIPNATGTEALDIAKKLLNLINNLEENEKLPYWSPSFSLGIIEMDDSIISVSDLLNKSDEAMYKSKKSGGNSATLFNPKKYKKNNY